MAKKERLYLNINTKAQPAPAEKPQTTDMKKSVRLYIRIK